MRTLRSELEPAVASAIPGAHADLTGDYAGNLDFTSRLSNVTPLVIAFVLGLAFILLIATFRSWQLALSVIGLNLLSVGAAFGVLVAVFQHHWAQSLLGFQSDGQVVDWLPLFAFVVLFGLSMDYTVLVLERAREARPAGREREARPRATALGSTGGTVTSAALVMIAVFSVFATLPLLEFKQLGVGLAAAIALDATIVRGLALPAALTLLGDRGLAPARASRRRAPGLGSWSQCRSDRIEPMTDQRPQIVAAVGRAGGGVRAVPRGPGRARRHLGGDRSRLLLADVGGARTRDPDRPLAGRALGLAPASGR